MANVPPTAVPLSPADTAWWQMEEPTNQMVITGILTLDAPLDYERLRQALLTRLVTYDRFRQRVVESANPFGTPHWVEDEAFSLDRHLERVSLPGEGDNAAMEALVSELMSRPLELDRPLWKFYYVDNLEGGSALVARIHHCIADGLALVQVILSIDDTPGNESPAAVMATTRGDTLPRPTGLRGGAKVGGMAAAALGRLVTMGSDPGSPLQGPLSMEKRVSWSRAYPLAQVRDTARALGATVNDLMSSSVAGALHHYLAGAGEAGRGLRDLRAVVPVNLRGRGDWGELGNKFGLVFLKLPVGLRDPMARLRELKRSMDQIKLSAEAVVVFGLLKVFGRTTRPLVKTAVRFLGRSATLVMTNVPGPRETVRFCGANIRTVMAWVPQSGRLGLGISIISYAGEVRVGVASDAGLLPDPRTLVTHFERSLEEILAPERVEQAG